MHLIKSVIKMNETTYIQKIKNGLLEHSLFKKERLLNTKNWKKSGFELASDIIGNSLYAKLSDNEKQKWGFSISSKTIQNIFSGSYRLTFPLDPRNLATLEKLARFCNYSSWDEFATIIEAEIENKIQLDDNQSLLLITELAANMHFNILKDSKEKMLESLPKYYASESSAYNSIINQFNDKDNQNLSISNEYNPSTLVVMNQELLKRKEAKAMIKSEEYWLLCWWDNSQNKYVKREKDLQENIYILENIDNIGWKVTAKVSPKDIVLEHI